MNRESILLTAEQMLHPLRVFEAETMAKIVQARESGWDDRDVRRLDEAIHANRVEMQRWTDYFANMLAMIPSEGFLIVGSSEDIAEERFSLEQRLSSVAHGEDS